MRTPRILFLILLLTLGHNWTFGCDCNRTTSEEYFRRAEVVFTGKVLRIITDTNFWSTLKFVDRHSNPNYIELAQIEITEVFKGLNPRLKYVSIPIDHSSCQYNFTAGSEYLIYAVEIIADPGIIMTYDCSGNHIVMDKLTEEFKLLRQLKDTLILRRLSDHIVPLKKVGPKVIPKKDEEWPWIGTALIFSVVVNVGLLIYYRARRI